jgi:hypothetical protein
MMDPAVFNKAIALIEDNRICECVRFLESETILARNQCVLLIGRILNRMEVRGRYSRFSLKKAA